MSRRSLFLVPVALAVIVTAGLLATPAQAGGKDTNDNDFNVDVDGSTLAIDGGVRWYFVKNRSWEPYVGGGVAYISGDLKTSGENNDVEFDDSTVGYWVNGGIKWVIGEHFNLGGDVRYEKAELDVEDDLNNPVDIEAGGLGYAVLLGSRW